MANGLFKYFPTDGDKLEWFTSGQILLTPPEFFNDPWDFLVRFEPWSDAELKEQCPSSMLYSADDFREFKAAMTSTGSGAEESLNYQKEIGKVVGVVSLTENPLDRRMWAHYAESHCGFVAEFRHDVERLNGGFRLRKGPFGDAAKVSYPKHAEQQLACKRDSSNIAEVLWTKHSEWEYEEEWRVVQSVNRATPGTTKDGAPRLLLRFESSHLIRVIFGLRIRPAVEAKLREMLGRPEFNNVSKEKTGIDPATRELISRELSK
jgi:hypothetical protein